MCVPCSRSRFRWRLRSARFCPACPPASRLPTLSMGCVRTAKTKTKTAETSERRGAERSRSVGESRPFLVIINNVELFGFCLLTFKFNTY